MLALECSFTWRKLRFSDFAGLKSTLVIQLLYKKSVPINLLDTLLLSSVLELLYTPLIIIATIP